MAFENITSPLISIVTPVYNQGETLRETIESVLSQNYKNIEYIVVDDGSSDETPIILEDYKSKIRIIKQENQGQSIALNNGWRIASGDYLTYLSADDLLYPHAIQTIVDNLNDEAIVFYPDFDLIDVDSNVIRTTRTQEFNVEDLVCKLNCQPGLSTVFKADLIGKIGGWDKSYRFIPDFEFWARASQYGSFQRVDSVVGGFRIHENSGSVRSVSEKASDEIIRFVNAFDYCGFDDCKSFALSRAFLISARSHLQSGRFFLGLKRYLKIFGIAPIFAIKYSNIIFLLNGLFRRYYYRMRSFIVGFF